MFQDLHIHTVFSRGDSAVVPEQTVSLVANFPHAEVIGISDHLDYVHGSHFPEYERAVRDAGFHLGVEVDGAEWVGTALNTPVDYYLYHCRDETRAYKGAERLLSTGKPVIISHPQVWRIDHKKVPSACLIEVNNRYVWRFDWRSFYNDFLGRFRFVIGSDAHQPNWLSQNIARGVAAELGIEETVLFPARKAE